MDRPLTSPALTRPQDAGSHTTPSSQSPDLMTVSPTVQSGPRQMYDSTTVPDPSVPSTCHRPTMRPLATYDQAVLSSSGAVMYSLWASVSSGDPDGYASPRVYRCSSLDFTTDTACGPVASGASRRLGRPGGDAS